MPTIETRRRMTSNDAKTSINHVRPMSVNLKQHQGYIKEFE